MLLLLYGTGTSLVRCRLPTGGPPRGSKEPQTLEIRLDPTLRTLQVGQRRGGLAKAVDPVGHGGIATLKEVLQRFYFLPAMGACGVQFGIQPRPVCCEVV